MSAPTTTPAETQAAAPQLPSVKQAYDTVFQRIHATAFFEKLASHGIVPATHEEAASLLDMGAQLMMLPEEAPTNRFAKVSSDLGAIVAQRTGVNPGQQANDQHLTKIAMELCKDPEIYNSVLVLKQAEAQHYAAQAG